MAARNNREHTRKSVLVQGKSEEDQIKELLENNFTCPICLDIVKKPLKAKYCGHVFCKICLNDWLRIHHTCPQCRRITTVNTVMECKRLEKIILVMSTNSTTSSASTSSTTTIVRRSPHALPNRARLSMCDVKLSERPPWH